MLLYRDWGNFTAKEIASAVEFYLNIGVITGIFTTTVNGKTVEAVIPFLTDFDKPKYICKKGFVVAYDPRFCGK